MKRSVLYLGFLILGAFLLLSCSIFSPAAGQPSTIEQSSSPIVQTVIAPVYIPPAADLVSLEDQLVTIYNDVNPGVVAIRSFSATGDNGGTGFVLNKEGHIITNYHVVENMDDLEVAFPNGLKTRAEIVGTDLDSDIAVIQVDIAPEELHPLSLGDSDQIQIGQAVIAIGNPFGFNGTMTLGIVSGLGRAMRSLHEAPSGGVFSSGDIIQTDAAINPGNSGGPLLNLNGEVIGVNRAIFTTNFSETGQPLNSGLGFAISINIVKRVIHRLSQKGNMIIHT